MVSPYKIGQIGQSAPRVRADEKDPNSWWDAAIRAKPHGLIAQLDYFGDAVSDNLELFWDRLRQPESARNREMLEQRLSKAKSDTERAQIVKEAQEGIWRTGGQSTPPLDVDYIDPELVSSDPDVGYRGTDAPEGVDPATVSTQPPVAPAPPSAPSSAPPTDPGYPSDPDGNAVLEDTARKQAERAWRKPFDARRNTANTNYRNALLASDDAIGAARDEVWTGRRTLAALREKTLNFEIDPKRAYPNAFSKLMAVISVGMGAYAEGLSGGKLKNTALQIMNDAIERDLQAQKLEYQKLQGLVDTQRNVVAQSIDMLGNEQRGMQAARTLAYQTLTSEMKQITDEMNIDFKYKELEEKTRLEEQKLTNVDGKRAKMSKEARAAIAGAGAVQALAPQLGAASEEVGEFIPLLTWINSILPLDTDAKRFKDTSEQLVLSIINAFSGLTMTEFEHEKFDRWTPKAHESMDLRRAKLTRLMRLMVARGGSWLPMEPPHVQKRLGEVNPELMWMMDPNATREEKDRRIQQWVYNLFAGKDGRGSVMTNTYRDLGGETVSSGLTDQDTRNLGNYLDSQSPGGAGGKKY